MKKDSKKWLKISVYILLILIIAAGVIYYSNMDFTSIVSTVEEDPYGSASDMIPQDEVKDEDTCIVKVEEIIEDYDYYDKDMDMLTRKQVLYVKVLSGPRKGELHNAVFDRTDLTGKKPYELCKVGAKLLCFFTVDSNGNIVDDAGTVTGYYRMPHIIWACVIFALLLLLLTGKRGLRSFSALLATCVSIILIMLPMILNGMNPILASVIGCAFSIITTLVLIYGFTVKTFAAALGAAGGVTIAGIFTAVMSAAMHLTGITSDEASQLALHFADGNIDLNGIMFAAILIGSLGGTIDVGISIASALDEMREHAPDITAAEMAASGIKIGSDIMSASLNTLILAYVGGAIHLLLMLRINGIEFIDVSSEEVIISEMLRGLAGSFGLLLTVPITSFVSAALLCRGGLGKFSLTMIPAIESLNEKRKKMSARWDEAKAKAESSFEEPENLYSGAQKRSSQEDFESGSDYDDQFVDDFGETDYSYDDGFDDDIDV